MAPHGQSQAGAVGSDLFQNYHAITASGQQASLGFQDGSLVDLNSGTDLLITDPLHTTLNQGELFLEVAAGASHQVQVGTAVATCTWCPAGHPLPARSAYSRRHGGRWARPGE